MEINCGVYLVTCTANSRKYVGSSQNIKARWREHRFDLRHNQHHNRHWQNAWNKYGESVFEWSILEETEASDDEIRAREKHWIDTLHPEFNVSTEAFPTRLGATNTEEHKRKMSEGMKKAWANLSEDERAKWIESGKKAWANLTPEQREERIRKTRYTFNETDIEKMRTSRLKYLESHPPHGRLKKQVYVYHYRPVVHTAEWEAGRAERERARIEKVRQANLGLKRTEEQKQKTREAANAMWTDPEYRAKHQEATQKAMQDPDVLQRLSDSHKGYVMPEEQKQKIREANTGRKRSEATRKRLSEARRRMWAEKKAKGEADAIRQKIANTRRGQKQSEETKAKKRKAQQARRERERLTGSEQQ